MAQKAITITAFVRIILSSKLAYKEQNKNYLLQSTTTNNAYLSIAAPNHGINTEQHEVAQHPLSQLANVVEGYHRSTAFTKAITFVKDIKARTQSSFSKARATTKGVLLILKDS